MGNFYTNIVLRGATDTEVADELREMERSAFVSRVRDGVVVVYDSVTEEQNPSDLEQLAVGLSSRSGCPAWAVMNHDDSLLIYQLVSRGTIEDRYESAPGYFETFAEPAEPIGGDAELLAAAFGVADARDEIKRILTQSTLDPSGYVFEYMRHAELAKALGIPAELVCVGFNYLDSGELPEGFSESDFVRVG